MASRLPRWLVVWLVLVLAGGCNILEDSRTVPPGARMSVASWIEPAGGRVAIEQVAALSESQWRQGPDRQNYGYTDRVIWYRIVLELPGYPVTSPWVLEFASPVLDRLDVYQAGGPREGGWQAVVMGDKMPFAARPLSSRNFAVPVVAEPGARAMVYVRVASSSSLQLPTRLVSQANLAAGDTRALIVDASYIGLMAGLLLFNLLLFTRVRESLYLYYVAWLFSIGVFVLGYDGMAFQYFWPTATAWNDLSIVLSLFASMVFLKAFWLGAHREYLGTRRIPGAAVWLAVLAVGGLALTLLPYRLAIQMTIILSLVLAAALIWMAIHAGRNGFAGARGLVTSFLPLLVGGYMLALQRYGLIGHLPLIQHAVAAGSALQAIMLSALLADRLIRLRELRAAAHEMTRFNQSLEESNAALEASNSALKEALQVSEARALAITDMKEKLRQTADDRNREKSKFLAQAVHDLKQPLQAITLALTPIQALLARQAADEVGELIDVVQRASQVMRNQITGLLDLSRLESGFVQPQISVFALTPLLETLLDPLVHFADARAVRIVHEPGEARVFVRSDPDLLAQILTNLIGNAIKYADPAKAPECRVAIRYRDQAGTVAIEIADNGLGIDQTHLASGAIFQPFFQANNTLPEDEKGVGLGLSIVSAAVALLPEHRIAIDSRPGVGSTFTVNLPAAGPPSQVAGALAKQTNLRAALDGKYVLLIDDDVLIRRSIMALLDCHGVRYDDYGALAALQAGLADLERSPDVLLCDYRLPEGKTAFDVMALLATAWPGVPTVVVTGDAAAATALAQQLDIFAVLHKPVTPDELLDRLAAACASTAA